RPRGLSRRGHCGWTAPSQRASSNRCHRSSSNWATSVRRTTGRSRDTRRRLSTPQRHVTSPRSWDRPCTSAAWSTTLGDKTVTWIRRKDLHVLTVGLDTYVQDPRFQAIHLERSNDWALQIRYAQLNDQGLYECQVSSDPKMSLFVRLRVLVARAEIVGASSGQLFLKTGSTINLTCEISQSPEPPVFVFWYHNDRMINYDEAAKSHILVRKAGRNAAVSRLLVHDAVPSDSGNYTCGPSNADATSVAVFVLNGEKPAAIQHDSTPPFHSPTVGVRLGCGGAASGIGGLEDCARPQVMKVDVASSRTSTRHTDHPTTTLLHLRRAERC
ncbi:hypothetical protein MRX96_049819, partial [Rhipicephalus microplus]